MGNKFGLVIFFFFLLILSIFIISSPGHTAFNHFILLADSFLKGHLYVEEFAPWLEQIPLTESKFFVANPPMPAILAMYPVLLFGKTFPQEYLSFFLSSLLAVITVFISLRINNSKTLALWTGILVSLGSINWYLGSIGSTWYIAHIVAQVFLSFAILSNLKDKNPLLTGLFLGFAYLARIPVILTLPFFVFNFQGKNLKSFLNNLILLSLGIMPAIIFNSLYNYLRFGVIWDIGYTLIPGVSTEPWYARGVIHPSYIINHLKIFFLAVPPIPSEFPLGKPTLAGYAILFTTPAFLFSLFNKIKERLVWTSWLAILLVSLIIFSHGSTGFSQFGYRFATDFYPFLILLTIKGVANQGRPKWYHWLFLVLGVLVNFWGILSLKIP